MYLTLFNLFVKSKKGIPAYHNVNLNLHFNIKSTVMTNANRCHISLGFLFILVIIN